MVRSVSEILTWMLREDIRSGTYETTHSDHQFWRHPDLLKPSTDQVVASRSNQVRETSLPADPVGHKL